MGFGVHRFSERVDDNLLCAICRQVLEGAVLTPCGHSFCQQCLDTWLSGPATGPGSGSPTCPQCRGPILPGQAKPILALRSLIAGLNISCDHRAKGCRALTTLDKLATHLEVCNHVPIECAGCSTTVSRADLPDHQIRCRAIAALLEETVDLSNPRPLLRRSLSQPSSSQPKHDAALQELSVRVSSLEEQLTRMKHDLQLADQKNQQLGHDLQLARQQLEDRRRDPGPAAQQLSAWNPDCSYGYTAQSVHQLSALLLIHQRHKPSHVDVNKVYDCVRRCYDNFGHNRKDGLVVKRKEGQESAVEEEGEEGQERDAVHVLVAAAQACDWFTEHQRLNFHCWLQSIARHKQFLFIQNYH